MTDREPDLDLEGDEIVFEYRRQHKVFLRALPETEEWMEAHDELERLWELMSIEQRSRIREGPVRL